MFIFNATDQTLYIPNSYIKPGEGCDVGEHVFDTIDIHCNIGSSQIVCEYGQRYIKNFGNIIAEETDDLDADCKKYIVVKFK